MGEGLSRSLDASPLPRVGGADGTERRRCQETDSEGSSQRIVLTVNIVVRSGGGVSEEKIRVPPTPVGLAHIPQRSPPVIRDVNAVEKG